MKLLNSITFFLLICLASVEASDRPSAIFIHPDGTGLGHWNALRHVTVGPDGMTNWDRLDRLAAYRPHQKNWLTTTSHAGATVHAYGKKVHYNSFGLDRDEPLTALSGKPMTIMQEAMAAGIRVGVINTGHICEPGSAVFLASNEDRYEFMEIAPKVMESGADLIFSGGEVYMLPEGVIGQHGHKGQRKDGRNLIEEARARGYTVIFTREELQNLDASTGKVIGVFAAKNTYNAHNEAQLKKLGLPAYNPDEPSFDEMVRGALKVLGSDAEAPFFIVAEEEGTDNFSNATNAYGMLEAIRRADKGIGEVLAYMEENPERKLSLIVGADSDAGHPTIWSPKNTGSDFQLPLTSSTGAALDGIEGQGGKPFRSAPDANGNSYPFGIAWATSGDYPGSVVTKTHGYMSGHLGTSIDNTGIYKFLYKSLFGNAPWKESETGN